MRADVVEILKDRIKKDGVDPEDAKDMINELLDSIKNPPYTPPGRSDPHAPGVFGPTGGKGGIRGDDIKVNIDVKGDMWIKLDADIVKAIRR